MNRRPLSQSTGEMMQWEQIQQASTKNNNVKRSSMHEQYFNDQQQRYAVDTRRHTSPSKDMRGMIEVSDSGAQNDQSFGMHRSKTWDKDTRRQNR